MPISSTLSWRVPGSLTSSPNNVKLFKTSLESFFNVSVIHKPHETSSSFCKRTRTSTILYLWTHSLHRWTAYLSCGWRGFLLLSSLLANNFVSWGYLECTPHVPDWCLFGTFRHYYTWCSQAIHGYDVSVQPGDVAYSDIVRANRSPKLIVLKHFRWKSCLWTAQLARTV